MYNIKEVERLSGQGYIDPILGKPLRYDDGFDANGNDVQYEASMDKNHPYWKPGKVSSGMIKYGVPGTMRGKLGCGCRYAVLHGVGEINQDGTIETDYMCDYGYHNYIVFQLEMVERGKSRKIDKWGNIVDGESLSTGGGGELGEY